jgi:hypothetical protein
MFPLVPASAQLAWLIKATSNTSELNERRKGNVFIMLVNLYLRDEECDLEAKPALWAAQTQWKTNQKHFANAI